MARTYLRILPQAAEHLRVRPCDPLRGFAEALPVRILADSDQDLAHGSDDAIMIEFSDSLREVDRVNAPHAVAAITTNGGGLVELGHRKSGPLCGCGSDSPVAGNCDGTGECPGGCGAPPAGI